MLFYLHVKNMRILDYSNKTEIIFSGNWQDWLATNGYPSLPAIPDDKPTLVLIQGSNDWAMYHPPVGTSKGCEVLYVRIPTKDEAEELLDLSAQMIEGLLSLLGGLRISDKNAKTFLISNQAELERFVSEELSQIVDEMFDE